MTPSGPVPRFPDIARPQAVGGDPVAVRASTRADSTQIDAQSNRLSQAR